MAITITNEDIARNLNNVLATVQGEKPLLEKLEPFIEDSKMNFFGFICDADVIEQSDNIPMAKRIIILDAFYYAVPSLDLVLTPNGFGVVSNSNVAPASKERVENLRKSLMASRDVTISAFWNEMRHDEKFRSCRVGKWLMLTIFQSLSDMQLVNPESPWFESLYTKHSSFVMTEEFVEKAYISKELMQNIREHLFTWSLTNDEQRLYEMVKANLIKNYKEGFDCESFRECVDFIRKTPSLFDVWKETYTATLFEDHSFKNNPKAGGVWL